VTWSLPCVGTRIWRDMHGQLRLRDGTSCTRFDGSAEFGRVRLADLDRLTARTWALQQPQSNVLSEGNGECVPAATGLYSPPGWAMSSVSRVATERLG
jgi:hypothetical protein